MATVEELLREAAAGRVGVDRRLIRSILEQNDPAAVLRFAQSPHDQDRLDLDPLLIDLLRHFRSEDALGFFVDAIRRAPEDVPDELIQSILPFGEKAIGPLIDLYHELGEEQGSDLAFVIAGMKVRDPRVLELMLERLEFDAADGAMALGLLGDPAARPALEKLLAEIPGEDVELRREITYALSQLEETSVPYESEPFDILAEYSERVLPAFDMLTEPERISMLSSDDPEVRTGAAYSFFNVPLNGKTRAALLAAAKSDEDLEVRGRAWASLSDATEDASIREALTAVLNDASKTVQERGGAAVGLHLVANREEVRQGIVALYELGGKGRARALEAMWRSLWQKYAEYFPSNLDETDPDILRQALRGAGYFELTRYAEKIAGFFDREEPYAKLREDALFAYALAMPGETTRGRVRGMLRKIDSLAELTPAEAELVEFALDERLRLHGLEPVFNVDEEEEEEAPAPEPVPQQKVGRNDPCPCGSGKKYKKCHGA